MSFLERFQASLESLIQFPDNTRYVVAYSGGLDSHVLLYCCSQLKLPVRAVHVHHGLQRLADEWVLHCQRVCRALGVELDVIYVDARKQSRQSPEEAARIARYQALKHCMRANEVLLTAQHLNDQAETLLLQLFRTASSAGLSAMPSSRAFGDNIHLRPLLAFSRQQIESYATENDLSWVEDPSNQDVSFDRNFVRQQMIPVLENRWPAISQQLAIVAGLQSNNLQVMEDMAAIDLANAIRTPPVSSYPVAGETVSMLCISCLQRLSAARLYNLLRYWLMQATTADTDSGERRGPCQTRKLLEEIARTIIDARQDARPVIRCAGHELRKFRDNLYLLKPGPSVPAGVTLEWKPQQRLFIPGLNIEIRSASAGGSGLDPVLRKQPLSIRFRQGSEVFHPAHRPHSQSLKKLFQEAGIPPWQRDTIPLLFYGDELIAVIGLWLSRQHSVSENEDGWVVVIEKS